MSDRRRTYLNNLVENMTYLGRYSIDVSNDNNQYNDITINLAEDIPSQFHTIIIIGESDISYSTSSSSYPIYESLAEVNNLGYTVLKNGSSYSRNYSVYSSESTYRSHFPGVNLYIGLGYNQTYVSYNAGLYYNDGILQFKLNNVSDPNFNKMHLSKSTSIFDLIGINE